MHSMNLDKMAGSTVVDLTSERPLKRDFIDLTATGGDVVKNSAISKKSQPIVEFSNGLSILESPLEPKLNSNAKPRFAYKSSSAKSQHLIPKSGKTSNIDRDQPNGNGIQREAKVELTKSLTELFKAPLEQKFHDLDQPLPNDQKPQIPETLPKVSELKPSIPESSKIGENSIFQDQELVDKTVGRENPPTFEVVQYDVESLEVSLEAFKNSLQQVLARVYNKHQTHVQQVLSGVPGARMQQKSAAAQIAAKITDDEISPFSKIRSQQSIALSKPRSSLQLGWFESFTGHRGKKHPQKVCMPRTIYTSSDDTLPLSDEYISTKCNVLTGNEDFPTQVPFQGDQASIDSDYQDLESQILQNRAVHIIKLDAGEKAEFYQPYLHEILGKMGCNVTELLYYLLDDTSPVAPSDLPPSLISLWTDREIYLDDGYFSEADESDHDSKADEFGARRPQKKWTALLKELRRSASISHKSATALACAAFANLTGISLWQVLKNNKYVLSMSSPAGTSKLGVLSDGHESSLGPYSRSSCLSCFMHDCPGHGELSWEDKENPSKDWSLLNAVPLKARCKLRGMDKDKAVSSRVWTTLAPPDSSFLDEETCSSECFWAEENRRERIPSWSPEESDLFMSLLPAYLQMPRAPCILALATNKPCAEIFWAMLQTIPSSIPVVMRQYNETVAPKHAISRHSLTYWQDNSETWRAEHRPPFIPCDHTGPCSELTDCSCFKNAVACEKSCMCASTCVRRLGGCRCDGSFCGDKRYCECARLNRECDPDLCRKCGVREALNPIIRLSTTTQTTKCRNSAIQRGTPCRTLMGESKMLADAGLQGWGLYAGEKIAPGDYVGEYAGEVISNEEGDRRGTVYDMRQMSYLFCLNKEQWIDSTYIGNKTRFINHQAKASANVEPRVLLCNMVHRIGMFAKRTIELGEELFFDYGTFFTRKFDLVAVQESETTVLKNPREGLSVEKQKRGRKSKQPIAKLILKPLRSAVPSLPLSKLTLRGPDPMLNPPTNGILKATRKRMRKEGSSPVSEPVHKRRLVRTQFGKRNLDSESEYGETSRDGITVEGGDEEEEEEDEDEDEEEEEEEEEEASIDDEDSADDVVEEEVAEEEETESAEEPDDDDDDEISEEDITPVRQVRKVTPKKGIARKPRKGSHRTEAARRALAEERLRVNALIRESRRTRSNSRHVTPVPRTRSARGTPDERSRTSQTATGEDAKAIPRSGLLSKVARKGRK